jgi:DNA-binding NtrC family response regulator
MDMLSAILIVDDNEDVHQAARLALAPFVGRVESAYAPADVVAGQDMSRFECVLLDMNFAAGERSGREGLSTLDRIKAADPTLAVLSMTAFGGVSLAIEALKRGAGDFLLKPWRNDALVTAVREAAGRTRAARAGITLDMVERSTIANALDRHGGNIAQAAGSLGLTRPSLYRRMAKHGL